MFSSMAYMVRILTFAYADLVFVLQVSNFVPNILPSSSSNSVLETVACQSHLAQVNVLATYAS